MKRIKKPEGYVSHRIVYDPFPILVVNLNYTVFQAQMKLGDDHQAFEVKEDGNFLVIRELD